MVRIHDVQQRTPEWEALRVGRVGGSDAISLTTDARMKTAIFRTVAELMTGTTEDTGYVSEAMQRGIDLEPYALEAYEKETFSDIELVGYLTNDNYQLLGLSPDGLMLYQKGAIEVKCPTPKKHAEVVIGNKVPAEWRPQVAHYFLMIPNLKWVDFVSYCPEFRAVKMKVIRCHREDKEWSSEIARLVVGYAKFENKVKKGLKEFGLDKDLEIIKQV